MRPCDGHETAASWIAAVTSNRPTCLVLTRQNLPLYEATDKRTLQGGYVLSEGSKPQADVILMASGSEVALAMEAQKVLAQENISARVVSMPCMELFLEQSESYQESVLPANNRKRLAIEAGASMPWYRFVGLDGKVIAMDHYGASAPAEVLFEQYGFTVDAVVEAAKAL